MRLKLILLFGFIIINGFVWFITEITKNQRIEISLDNDLKQLQTDYETLQYHQKVNNKVMLKNINSLGRDVFNQLSPDLTEEELTKLRTRLYNILYKRYKLMKIRGVYQLHFVLPDNKTFLRVHRPSKYGDDLSGIRYSYEFVNKHHMSIEGYEGGRLTGAYRNVYPIFNDKGKYVCAVDFSYTSDYLQNYLTTISKLHTHFLVHRKIFKNEIWKRKDKNINFQQSSEHEEFMLTMTKQHTIENCIINNQLRLSKRKSEIASKMEEGKPFAIYVNQLKSENKRWLGFDTISFYPVKSTQETTSGWLVAYKPSEFIENTCLRLFMVRAAAFIVFSFIFYLLYQYLKQQELLKEQKDELESLFNYSKDGIAIFNKESKFLDCNQAYLDMVGFTKEEILEKTCIELTVPEERERSLAVLNTTLKQGFIKNFEKTCLRKDGERVEISMTASVLPDKKRILAITKDITEENKKDRILSEQNKNASMGEMIGNIAHQWRQPLSVISSGATGMLMQKQFDKLDDEQFEKTCNAINENAQYLSKTIDDFTDFISGDREFVSFNLKRNIENFLSLVEPSLKKDNIQLILNLDESIEFKGYPSELIQCFINVFNNAKDALEDSLEQERYIFIDTDKEDGKAIIKFKDNAGGIDENILPQIFEPYFTTKHKSQGTGLGLHMTFNLITEGMQGSITAENVNFDYEGTSYKGAEFTIVLPVE